MKKLLLLLGLIPFLNYAQVGVNTTDPKTALDVVGAITNREVSFTVASNAVNINTETSLAKITGAATAVVAVTSYTPLVNGHRLIVSNNTSGGFGATFAGITIPNNQAIEFIYTGGAWKTTIGGSTSSTNIYNADGTLIGPRVVSQGSNNLSFIGTGNTNFNAGNVGIGTITPSEKLEVSGKTKTTDFQMTNGAINGYVLASDASGNSTWTKSFLPYTGNGVNTPTTATRDLNDWVITKGTSIISTDVVADPTNKPDGLGAWFNTGIQSTAAGYYSQFLLSDQNMFFRGGTVAGINANQWRSIPSYVSFNKFQFNTVSALVDSDLTMMKTGNFALAFGTNNLERMRISNTGNVGIGTAAPTAQFHTTGTVRFSGAGSALLGRSLVSDAAGNATWQNPLASNSTSTAITASTTQVAVPSTNVQGAINDLATAVKAAQNSTIYTSDGTLTGPRVVSQGSNNLNFTGTGNTTFTSGMVGVGTSSPSSDFTLFQSSGATNAKGFRFTGNSYSGISSGTGFVFGLGYNAVGNKQLWFGDPDLLGNDVSGIFFRMNGSGLIDAVSGAGSFRRPVSFGVAGDTNSGVILGSDSSIVPPSSFVWANGNMAIGSSYRSNAAPANGLIIQGNTGIGTTNPTAQFHTTGTVRFSGAGTALLGRSLVSDAAGNATWQNPLASNSTSTAITASATQVAVPSTNVQGAISDLATAVKAAQNSTIYTSDGSLTGNRIVTQNTNTLAFTSTATNGFSVDGTTFSVDAANDRIGIGTSTPTTTLDVGGNFKIYGNAIGDFSGAELRPHVNTGSFTVYTGVVGSGTPRFTVTNAGSVGIGTLTPTAQFHTTGTVRFSGAGTALLGRSLVTDAAGNATWQNPLASNSTSTAIAASATQVAVPSTNVQGAISDLATAVKSASLNSWTLDGNSNGAIKKFGTIDAFDVPFITSNTERMRILSSGNVGVGTTSPFAKFQVNIGSAIDGLVVSSGATWDGIGFAHDASTGYINAGGVENGIAFRTNISASGTFTTNPFTEQMRILANGNVGIGTATPATKLDVAAGTTSTNTVVNATGNINDFLQFNVQNTSTGTKAQSGYSATADNGSSTTGFAWMGINNSTFNYPTAYNIGLANDVSFVGSGQDLYLANANNTKSIIFSTGKSTSPFFNERMRITNAGNVGIGTTIPNAPLQFSNTLVNRKAVLWEDGNNDHQFYGFGINSSMLRYQVSGVAASHVFYAGTSATTSNELMRIQGDGNVGIGTSAPAQKLTISGSQAIGVDNGSTFLAKNSAGAYENFLWPRWVDNIMYLNYGAGGFNIRNNASVSAMFMTNSGFVGFGVTPITKLDVSGVKSTGAGTGTGGSNDAASQAIIPAGNNGASRYNDWPAGWGGGLSTWDVVGASTVFNSYLTRSDFRLKNDIKSIDNSIFSNFMKIRPVTYFMKEQTKEMEGLQYGFIAQEIRDLFPSMVTKLDDPNGTIGMNYQALISPTIYVVQQQQAKIDELQKQVDTQNEKLSKMEEELKQIKQMLSK